MYGMCDHGSHDRERPNNMHHTTPPATSCGANRHMSAQAQETALTLMVLDGSIEDKAYRYHHRICHEERLLQGKSI